MNASFIIGTIIESNDKTTVEYTNLPTLSANSSYEIQTKVIGTVGANNGELLGTTLNATVDIKVTGKIAGETQQSTVAKSVMVQTTNTSNLIFSQLEDPVFNAFTSNSWTISWIDINNDGWDDIYVTDMGTTAPNRIFMNNKTGGFTAGQVMPEDGVSMTNTWADVDNDGDEDLLVLNNNRNTNKYYRNDNGNLVADNSKSFTQDISYYHGGAFADYDHDNKVDAFMCNYFPTKYNELHKNSSDGNFSKVVSEVIPLEANSSLGPTWADYDQDGFLDLFVPNGSGNKNSLFHNDGNGTFSKANNIINQEGGKSVGSCWGDVDNDGDLDLFVTNSNSSTNFFYKNLGDGTFEKITNSIINQGASSHGCSFADIDNDGDLDLFVTNDRIRKFLYLNDGAGNFSENREEAITYNFGLSFGHSWSDFDHDGDLDLAVATHSNQKNYIFKNNGNTNNWLQINLIATVSNGSAIGAKIKVSTTDSNQFREVNSQSGFGGQSSYTQHYGLKNTAVVDTITVTWPSGIIQTLTNVAANQILQITEPQQTKVTGVVYFDVNSDGQKQIEEPIISRAALDIQPIGTKTFSNNTGIFTFYTDQNTAQIKVLAENGLQESATAINYNLANYNSTDIISIPATTLCSHADLKINMGGTAIRKGFTNNQFRIVASNQSRNGISNALVNFIVPSTVSIQNSSETIFQQESFTENGENFSRYTWQISALNAFENKTINFTTSHSSAVQIGNELTFKCAINSANSDCDITNNSITQKYLVYGAIDPNDILVSPKGYGEEGYIMANQELTYTIRFENIGNFPAQKVIVVDELPRELDNSTFKLVASSHENPTVEIIGQKITFILNDVYLPPTSEDATKSQGYFTFVVKPVTGIPAETKIENKASIQFDTYIPLVTNTVLNTIQSKEKEADLVVVTLYPNPVNDVAFLGLQHQKGEEFTTKKITKAEIITLQGLTVMTAYFNALDEVRMNLPTEYKGIYLVRITDTDGLTYVRKMMVKCRE